MRVFKTDKVDVGQIEGLRARDKPKTQNPRNPRKKNARKGQKVFT